MLRTWTNVDSDDILHRHCLDDMARLLMCQVVALSRRPSSVGVVTWRCHVASVVGGGRTMVVRGGGCWRQW